MRHLGGSRKGRKLKGRERERQEHRRRRWSWAVGPCLSSAILSLSPAPLPDSCGELELWGSARETNLPLGNKKCPGEWEPSALCPGISKDVLPSAKWESCILINYSIPHLCLAPEVQQRAFTASVECGSPSLPGDDQSQHRLLESVGLAA